MRTQTGLARTERAPTGGDSGSGLLGERAAAKWRSEAQHVRPKPNELSKAGGSPFPEERGEGADRGIGGPVDGGMRRAERAAPAASGLPCKNSNNYPKQDPKKGYVLHSKAVTYFGRPGMRDRPSSRFFIAPVFTATRRLHSS